MTANGPVPFTTEEEAARDAEEAAWAIQQAQPTPPAPTKEELLAQLNALSAQIQALE
jgi:sugar/nucleoside kinase (ribokinase family)